MIFYGSEFGIVFGGIDFLEIWIMLICLIFVVDFCFWGVGFVFVNYRNFKNMGGVMSR